MKALDFQRKIERNIQRVQLDQQIKLLLLATFENYQVKEVDSAFIDEVDPRDPLESFPLLKVWSESGEFLKVRTLGRQHSALDAEMIFLAMDILSTLGLEGLGLQLNERSQSSILDKYLKMAIFEYEYSELEAIDFSISLQTGGEQLEVCRSDSQGFDLSLEKLRIALEERETKMIEPVKLHAYVLVLTEQADLEASRLLLSLRQQAYSVDRNYSRTDLEIEEDSKRNVSADLLILFGEEEMASKRLTIKNLESQQTCDYSFSEVCSDFSSIYEEMLMGF